MPPEKFIQPYLTVTTILARFARKQNKESGC